jgi:hypothetical protein
MPGQRVCPYCGQLLVNRAAVEHLRREERRILEQAEKDATKHLRAELAPVIRKELEEEFNKERRAEPDKKAERLTAEVKELKRRRRIDVREKEQLRQQVEQMSRRMERLGPSERGDVGEEDLLQSLRRTFTSDDINPVGRGKAGADIVHRVRDKAGGEVVEVGTIVYESKDTLVWSEGWVAKAKADRERYGTQHIVIVSRAFPKNQKGLCSREGVPVVDFTRSVGLAHVIRKFIVEGHRAGLSGRDVDRKTEELYTYIRGDDFRRRLSGIVDISGKLVNGLDSERRQHTKLWNRRQQAYTDLETRATEIDEAIRGIIERKAAARDRVISHSPRRLKVRPTRVE